MRTRHHHSSKAAVRHHHHSPKTAVRNLQARIECKDPESRETLFDATFDKKLVFELGGKRYTYEWLRHQHRQHVARKASYANFTAEVFDSETFRYTYDFSEEGLPKTVTMHSLATVNRRSGKIVRVKVMTCEAATHVFRFHKGIHVEVESNSTRGEIGGSDIKKLDGDAATTINNQSCHPGCGYGMSTKGDKRRKHKPKQYQQREPTTSTTARLTERIKNDISWSKKMVSSFLSSSPGSIYSMISLGSSSSSASSSEKGRYQVLGMLSSDSIPIPA